MEAIATDAVGRTQIVTAVFDHWAAAIREHRPGAVASSFTEDVVFQGLDETHAVGRAGVADYYAKQPVGLRASFRILELRQVTIGDLLAYIDVEFARPDGTVIPVHLTAMLRNVSGEWQISHYHVSKIERSTGSDTPAGPEHQKERAETMNTSVTDLPTAEGAGAVSGAPNLPAGFADTFSSRYIQAGDIQLHAVIGGQGPALLLVHGWPESWYAWRLIMPELARHFTVVAVDQRGMGLSDKPQGGYDTRTLANDLVALMDALGHERFAIAGHDTGLAISYALIADHPDRVECAALLEIPGAPGTTPAPPFFVPAPVNDRLWHLSFNRVEDLPEKLITGREDVFYGYEFAIQGGSLSGDVIDYYVAQLSNPDSLRGGLGFYRAFDATLAQNAERASRKLATPLLGIGGELSYGDHVGEALHSVADNVETVVIAGAGHWVAEEAPEQVLAALTAFLAPMRDGRVMSSAR